MAQESLTLDLLYSSLAVLESSRNPARLDQDQIDLCLQIHTTNGSRLPPDSTFYSTFVYDTAGIRRVTTKRRCLNKEEPIRKYRLFFSRSSLDAKTLLLEDRNSMSLTLRFANLSLKCWAFSSYRRVE
jgi:hypothetical protein